MDWIIQHTIVHHSSTSTYKLNFVQIINLIISSMKDVQLSTITMHCQHDINKQYTVYRDEMSSVVCFSTINTTEFSPS